MSHCEILQDALKVSGKEVEGRKEEWEEERESGWAGKESQIMGSVSVFCGGHKSYLKNVSLGILETSDSRVQ